MALAVAALPFTFVVHLLGIVLIILVLVWNIHFRGGLAWDSSNKSLIFNVRFFNYTFLFFSHVLRLQLLYFQSSPECTVVLVLLWDNYN